MDIDEILKRRLYLQRFVTSLLNDVQELNEAGDKELIAAINEFVIDADEKTLAALAQRRTSNKDAQALLMKIKATISEQSAAASILLSDQTGELVEQEIAFMAAVMGGATVPSSRGVASLPVDGKPQGEIIATAYNVYSTRFLQEIVNAAATGPENMGRIMRGTRTENFRDGLFYWRDNRLLRPNIDQLVNGNAANAAVHTFEAYKVEQVEHLATLDFRTCPVCRAAELNGPYKVGKQPRIPVHPNCRCVNVPVIPGEPPVRPFVKDDRSVKDIPKSERDGKIGQTRDSIDKFFDRMTKQDRVDYMGPTRAALWEQGKIDDVRDLVNSRTRRPLRLDELPKPNPKP